MANLITPEFIPGMREAQKRKSAVGTADLRGAKFPEPDMHRTYGTHWISIWLLPCDESQGYKIGRACRHLQVATS